MINLPCHTPLTRSRLFTACTFKRIIILLGFLLTLSQCSELAAVEESSGVNQREVLKVATVDRQPFAFLDDNQPTGFSIELMNLISDKAGFEVEFMWADTFPHMLSLVEKSKADLAISNISITSDREEKMDFSHSMFDSGLKIMLPKDEGSSLSFIMTLAKGLGTPLLIALVLVFLAGIAMWFFERRSQTYFSKPLKKSLFSSFWWALRTTVNNGGWDEEVPRTAAGRTIATLLILISLLFVSVFTAHITTQMTVAAMESNVQSIHDLNKRNVGTTINSLASKYLSDRDILHQSFKNTDELFDAFASKKIDAIFFDGPILSHYAHDSGNGKILELVYAPAPYGIAATSGSEHVEEINKAILDLKENGQFAELVSNYFE